MKSYMYTTRMKTFIKVRPNTQNIVRLAIVNKY